MTDATTSDLFRTRLHAVMARTGLKQAGFARLTGIDRSTLSLLLSADTPRLPRADTLVAVARTCNVSVDWLLGLSPREEIGSEIVDAMLQVQSHARAPVDARFLEWVREAEGYRIRTVTETFPDFLKTEAVIRFEYQGFLAGGGVDPAEAIGSRLAMMRRPDADLEICAALQSFTGMALAQGRWEGLGLEARREQLRHLITLYDELYPKLQIYLFTLTETYSNPFTVFGPQRVALFLGTSFLVLNATNHVQLFNRRFDDLIRLAVVQPNQIKQTLLDLLDEIA